MTETISMPQAELKEKLGGDPDAALWSFVQAKEPNPAGVRLALAAGADANAANGYGWTVLMEAAMRDDANVVCDLLSMGQLEINARDRSGRTALMAAAEYGQRGTALVLLMSGAQVNVQDHSGSTAAMAAAKHGHGLILAALKEKGADLVTPSDRNGETTLMKAARPGDEDTINVVLSAAQESFFGPSHLPHADLHDAVNARDHHGETALMKAARNGRIDAARLLLMHGAKRNAVNHQGKTALSLARQNRQTETADLLESYSRLVRDQGTAIVQTPHGAVLAVEVGRDDLMQIFGQAGPALTAPGGAGGGPVTPTAKQSPVSKYSL